MFKFDPFSFGGVPVERRICMSIREVRDSILQEKRFVDEEPGSSFIAQQSCGSGILKHSQKLE